MQPNVLCAPNLAKLGWLTHGFGFRDTVYPAGITTVHQIHSCLVVHVAGAGGDRIAEADALVSGRAGMLVGVRTADCVPVLLADTRTRAVSAVHAGWRGSAGGIVGAALQEMESRFCTRPADVVAAVGPSIGVCCYEVGPEVARQFGTWYPELEYATVPSKIDLQAVNAHQLRAAGVTDVWESGECTQCATARYFSYRREKEHAGRMVSYIGTVDGTVAARTA